MKTNTYFIPGYLLGADAALFQALRGREEEPEIHLHTGEAQHCNPVLIGPQTN